MNHALTPTKVDPEAGTPWPPVTLGRELASAFPPVAGASGRSHFDTHGSHSFGLCLAL